MNQQHTPGKSMGSKASALLGYGALYGQLAWVELKVEKDRLLQLLLIMLAVFSMITSLLVSFTILLLVASWDTPWRSIALIATGAFYCAGFIFLWWRYSALSLQGNDAFSDTREELTTDIELIRNRFDK